MDQILPDNTVIPSFQGVRPRGQIEDTGNFSNLALRMGEVKNIVYPDDPKSISGSLIEYSVEVQHRDGKRPGTTSMYHGCLVANLFGGAADTFKYTLRKDDQSQTGTDGVGVGSKVLLLCVNGQTTRAMILGGLRDLKTNDADKDSKDDGHNLYFEFNGISFKINKDGEATLQFKGPTKVDGSLDTDAGASEDNGPTVMEITKDGNLEISTKDKKQSILVDRVNEKLVMTAGSTIALKSDKGVKIGDATDYFLLGTTYRNAESDLHQKMIEDLTDVATQLGVAAAAATGPLTVPTIGGMLAGPIIGPALLEAVTAITKMVAALTKFEASAATYLSQKNQSD